MLFLDSLDPTEMAKSALDFYILNYKEHNNIYIFSFQFCISMVGVVILTFTSVLFPPPTHLPDLFPLMISVYSCAHFIMFLIYFHHAQFSSERPVLKGGEKIAEVKKTDGDVAPKSSPSKKHKHHKKKKQH